MAIPPGRNVSTANTNESAPSGSVVRRSSSSLTSFVGRDGDIGRLSDLLVDPSVRLVTITGPGGVGKTRLAEELMSALATQFPDGVVLVELAAITDPEVLPGHLLRAFAEERNATIDEIDALCLEIGNQQILLVLDNMEQLIESAAVVQTVLVRCPGLTALVTSRLLLRVRGEHEYVLDPLPTEPESKDSLAPAVLLLTDRARAALGNSSRSISPDTARQICEQVDGLPLAIELAAAQMRVLGPDDVLSRLRTQTALPGSGPRDVPHRQQTMEAAVAWSIDLLSESEQRLFMRLSVFTGGFDLANGRAIADQLDETVYLNCLDQLISHSLVRRHDIDDVGTRFSMLETIRKYGREQLVRSGIDGGVREAHANLFVRLAHELGPQLRAATDAQYRVWKRIEIDVDNYRGAIDWFTDSQRPARVADLVGSLDWFWTDSHYVSEGYRHLQHVVDEPSVAAESFVYARALRVYAMLADHLDDTDNLLTLVERSIGVQRETGDLQPIAELLHLACGASLNADRLNEARTLANQTIEEAALRNQGWFVGAGEANLSLIETLAGDYKLARAAAERAADAFSSVGDTDYVLSAMNAVAYTWLFEGEYASAQAVYQDVLIRQTERMEDPYYFQHVCRGIAAVSAKTGRFELAARLMGMAEAEFLRTRINVRKPLLDAYNAMLDDARKVLGEETFDELVEEGRAHPKSAGIVELINLSEPPSLTDRTKRPVPFNNLSNREFEVLLHLMAGKTDPEIANDLFLSPRTVSQHVSSILNKLAVPSRTSAAAMAAAAKIR
jgi:predicted ATPase/DNA-binding CsgD family transcriptional regulator